MEEAAEEVAEVEHEHHQLGHADDVDVLEQVVLVPFEQPHDLEQPQQLDQAEEAEELEELEELPGAVLLADVAPVNLHGTLQRTLRRPQRQIHGEARQQIDREPGLEVVRADQLRMVDDDALLLLSLVAGAKVEGDVEPKVKVDEELDPVGRTLRGLLQTDAERDGDGDEHQDDRLQQVPVLAEVSVRVDAVPMHSVVVLGAVGMIVDSRLALLPFLVPAEPVVHDALGEVLVR